MNFSFLVGCPLAVWINLLLSLYSQHSACSSHFVQMHLLGHVLLLSPMLRVSHNIDHYKHCTFHICIQTDVCKLICFLALKAIITLMKELGWTRFTLISSSDIYGASGAADLLRLARQEKICVNFTILLNSQHFNPVQDLFRKLKKAADGGSVGVVFMGDREEAQLILEEVHLHEGRYPFLASLVWIMSDSIGTNMEVVTAGGSLSGGILTISKENKSVQEFIEFARNQLTLGRNSSVPYVETYTARNCNKQGSCENFDQQEHVVASLDAVYVLAAAVKRAHRKHCGSTAGVCDNLYSDNPVLEEVKAIDFNYSSMSPIRYPPEFSQRRVRLDSSGDIIHSEDSELYNINMFWKGSFHSVSC